MGYWHNKTVMVTGGSAGLGRSIAAAFAAAGARVVIVARDEARLQAAVGEFTSAGQNVIGLSGDVTNQADVDRVFAAVQQQFGELHALVNNAGRSTRGAIGDVSPEQFQELWNLNFLSVVRCTRAALPLLLASRGHLVQIGSLASKSAGLFLGAYPASKFPLAGYTQQLRLELGPQGLHVLLVCPGPLARDDSGERYRAASANLPEMARQPGGGVNLRRLDPHYVAARILRACERRQFELVLPWKAKLLFALQQMWPTLGDWLIRRNTR